MACEARKVNATDISVGNLIADASARYPAIPERRYGRQPSRLNLVGLPDDVARFNAAALRQRAILNPLLNNLVRDDILYHLEYDEDGEEPPAWAKTLIANLSATAPTDSDGPYEDQNPVLDWSAEIAAEAARAELRAHTDAARARARSAVLEEGRPPRDFPGADPRPYAPTRVKPPPNTYRVKRAAGAASSASRGAAESLEHLAEAAAAERRARQERADEILAAAAAAAATTAAAQAQRQQEDEAAIFAAAQQDGQAPNAIPVPPATDETERDIAVAQAEAHIAAADRPRQRVDDPYSPEARVQAGRQARATEAQRFRREARVAMLNRRRVRETEVDVDPPGPEEPISARTRARTRWARAVGTPLFDGNNMSG
ncbi:g7774 [Coccomyxa elongata]